MSLVSTLPPATAWRAPAPRAVRDVVDTERAAAELVASEARLRESEDHFRHTVELNPQVPWTCDPAGNITSYSNRWPGHPSSHPQPLLFCNDGSLTPQPTQ